MSDSQKPSKDRETVLNWKTEEVWQAKVTFCSEVDGNLYQGYYWNPWNKKRLRTIMFSVNVLIRLLCHDYIGIPLFQKYMVKYYSMTNHWESFTFKQSFCIIFALLETVSKEIKKSFNDYLINSINFKLWDHILRAKNVLRFFLTLFRNHCQMTLSKIFQTGRD